ncbi:hypothetical protein AAJV73_10235 [Cyanobium sp. BSA11S]|uniref:hypothetical protein n=1 Tax=Cyanobium sp. BSA11S TaxID=3108224 RepID=UPI003D815C24
MAWFPLLLYVVLKGLNATALKGLQAFGASHPIGGENPISFCNVFFVAQMIVGLTVLLPGRAQLPALLEQLEGVIVVCWCWTRCWGCSSDPWPSTSPWTPFR